MRPAQTPLLSRTGAQAALLQSQGQFQQQMQMSQQFIQQQNSLIQKQNMEIQQLRQQLLMLQQQPDAAQMQLQQLQMQYDELQQRYDALASAPPIAEAADSEMEELHEKYDIALQQNKQMLQRLREAKRRVQQLQDECDEYQTKYEKYKALSIKLTERVRHQETAMLSASQRMQQISRAQPGDAFNRSLAVAQLSNVKFELSYLKQSLTQVRSSIPQILLPSQEQIAAAVHAAQSTRPKKYTLPAARTLAVSRLAQASCQIQDAISQQLQDNDQPQFRGDFQHVFAEIVRALQLAAAGGAQQCAQTGGILSASALLSGRE